MKIIPAIDLMNGEVVRLLKGDPNNKIVYSKDPLTIAREYAKYTDTIHLIDLDAAFGIGNNKEIIKKIAKELTINLQVGGGIRDIDYAKEILKIAHSIILGTLAYNNEDTTKELLLRYGKDRIIVAIDHKDGIAMINGWRSNTKLSILDAIKKFKDIGIEIFLITNINRDGTLEGVDNNIIKEISHMGKIIYSGGVASIDDIKTLRSLGVYGVIIGKALYENKIKLNEIRYAL